MVIDNDFEISYLVFAFALLGVILIGGLLDRFHLQRLHPRLVGATLGALLGFALIEAVPLFT
jgi:UDP-N-acetylmuramyl pentapeptide phosphotransferase/UDP-N-acetylglucosamine-1-phosphate transferase